MALSIPSDRAFPFFSSPRLQAVYNQNGEGVSFDDTSCIAGFDRYIFCGREVWFFLTILFF